MSRKILSVVSLSLVIILLVTLVAFVGCTKATPTPTPTATPTPTKTAAPTTATPTPTATVAPPTATATPTPAAVIDPAKVLPKMIYWTAYDVGSSGYVQAAALADAIMKKYNVKVRVIPSGTSVGRLAPLKTGVAAYGLIADEAFYAANAQFEFAAYDWGPMSLRLILGHPAAVCLATAKDAGIKTAYDLKGKRMPFIPGAPTLNQAVDAALAFANLTWADVIKVEFPSYSAALKGIIEGKVDACKTVTTVPLMYELASSPRGIRWPAFPAEDKEGWKRLQAVMPWMSPRTETEGAGISKENPAYIWGYRYPQLVTLAKTDETEVYALIKALDETFDMYKDVMPGMWEWRIDLAGVPPTGAPFHNGAIKYLKEKGVWKAEYDAWNNAFLAQIEKIEKAWNTVLDEATGKSIKEADFPAYWAKRRVELGAAPFGS